MLINVWVEGKKGAKDGNSFQSMMNSKQSQIEP
jgi:hypothetical protein